MSEQRNKDGIRISQVLAGALAAVTAALVGSTMGVAGTIVGAGLASIVSTVGSALYLTSIKRTSESMRVVKAKVVGRSGDATVLVSKDDPEPGEEVAADTEPETPDSTETSVAPPPDRRRLRWPVVVAGSLAAFALGMLVVTGIEWVRGESLSGGEGTTFSSVVEQRHGGTQETPKQTPSDQPTTTTTPPTTEQTPTTTTPPTTTSSPTGSEPPTTTTTTEPPTTTTTVEPNLPGGTLPPSQ